MHGCSGYRGGGVSRSRALRPAYLPRLVNRDHVCTGGRNRAVVYARPRADIADNSAGTQIEPFDYPGSDRRIAFAVLRVRFVPDAQVLGARVLKREINAVSGMVGGGHCELRLAQRLVGIGFTGRRLAGIDELGAEESRAVAVERFRAAIGVDSVQQWAP